MAVPGTPPAPAAPAAPVQEDAPERDWCDDERNTGVYLRSITPPRHRAALEWDLGQMCRELASGDDHFANDDFEGDGDGDVRPRGASELSSRLLGLRLAQRQLQRHLRDGAGVRYVNHEFDSGRSSPVTA
jgi:hypothetical protein